MRLKTILTALLVLALALSACGAGKGTENPDTEKDSASEEAADSFSGEEASSRGDTGDKAQEVDLFRNVRWEGPGEGLQTGRDSLDGEVIELCLSISREGDPEGRTMDLVRQNLKIAGVPYALGIPEEAGEGKDFLAAAVRREDFDWALWQAIAGGSGSFALVSAGRTISSGEIPLTLSREGKTIVGDVSVRGKIRLYIMTEEAAGTRPVYLTAAGAPLAFAEPGAPVPDGRLSLTMSCLTGQALSEEELQRMDGFRILLETEPYPSHVYVLDYCLEKGGERIPAPCLPEMDIWREAADALFASLKDQVPSLAAVDLAPEPVFYLVLPAGEDLAGAYREAIGRLRELCPLQGLPGQLARYRVCDPGSGRVQYSGTLSGYGEPDRFVVLPIGTGEPEPAYAPWIPDLEDVLLSFSEGY